MSRVYNFSAGPSMLPEEVFQKAAAEMLDYEGCGQSVMEMSHRSKEYEGIIRGAESLMRELMKIPDNYKVLFLQGGASIKLGRAQGVAMAAALSRDIPITEYAPLKIKMAITGNGQASKEHTMKIYLLALPVNAFLNYCFIFGKLGMPRLGGVGAGVATGITYWLEFAIFVWIVHKLPAFEHFRIFKDRFHLDIKQLRENLSIGVPIGLAMFMESGNISVPARLFDFIFFKVILFLAFHNTFNHR